MLHGTVLLDVNHTVPNIVAESVTAVLTTVYGISSSTFSSSSYSSFLLTSLQDPFHGPGIPPGSPEPVQGPITHLPVLRGGPLPGFSVHGGGPLPKLPVKGSPVSNFLLGK